MMMCLKCGTDLLYDADHSADHKWIDVKGNPNCVGGGHHEKAGLSAQDLYLIRDAANALSDIDDDLAMELHDVGDKLAETLKLEIDVQLNP